MTGCGGHDALEHVVRITCTGWDLVRERCEAPLMTVAEPVCSVYVVHGISPKSCDRRHEVISLHEVSRASQQHKQLGVRFDGVARVLRHDPRRL